ncbi:probable serine/threonine-protein kinase samkC [Megalobrama amblycephala]|uniref:probable serine/threonine-protein kinase samkC n=1 Tax=Megalobrama amblycephala TaxID=75352 RepID=UPI0020147C95|nr:probable serine/threonine-protein kinase samkC [Megalobrama amblycephala]
MWLKDQNKNQTTSHVIDEASVLVEKLNTLGYKAIVFIGKKTKKQKTWSAQVLQPKWQLSDHSEKCLDRMKALFELLINDCTNQQSTTTSPPPIQPTTTSPPPIQSTTTSPPPIQSTTTSPPPIQSTTSSPILPITEQPQQKHDMSASNKKKKKKTSAASDMKLRGKKNHPENVTMESQKGTLSIL